MKERLGRARATLVLAIYERCPSRAEHVQPQDRLAWLAQALLLTVAQYQLVEGISGNKLQNGWEVHPCMDPLYKVKREEEKGLGG